MKILFLTGKNVTLWLKKELCLYTKCQEEVDKAKIDLISKLPPPTNVNGIRSFLGHAGFYRRFIKDFSKISRPLTKLLENDTPFEFNDECHEAFNSLKEKLTCTPVIVSPNWNLPFKLLCDAGDFAVGAVLGQKDGKHFHPIYFASKTLNAAQQKYTVTEKELIVTKSIENVAADHLSWIENDETSDDSDVDDNFPGENIMKIDTHDEPWFADFANYLAGDIIPKGMTYQQNNKFFSDLKHYFWEEPYLFKVCSDGNIAFNLENYGTCSNVSSLAATSNYASGSTVLSEPIFHLHFIPIHEWKMVEKRRKNGRRKEKMRDGGLIKVCLTTK
ncbi:reverse transcriptase domain-containing protein [Tanacetum coccineum]